MKYRVKDITVTLLLNVLAGKPRFLFYFLGENTFAQKQDWNIKINDAFYPQTTGRESWYYLYNSEQKQFSWDFFLKAYVFQNIICQIWNSSKEILFTEIAITLEIIETAIS